MQKRTYNTLFHLHTVSGIVISIGLFVIFFAGSFSFFRDDIIAWERTEMASPQDELVLDYDATLDSLAGNYHLYGRDIGFIHYYNERRIAIDLSGSKDTLSSDVNQASAYFYLDPETYRTHNYEDSYTLGEFLYRLHFFAQIPYPYGYYLSGFVALFSLFAIITGVLVHWDKIIKNFFVFRPWAKLKTLWTDAHTALGMIGLPFQFVYAVTGTFFMLSTFLVAPAVMALYDGDQGKLYEELGYSEPSFPFENTKGDSLKVNFNAFVDQTKSKWEGFRPHHVIIHNYGDSNMHVTVEGKLQSRDAFSGVGSISYQVISGEVVSQKDPVTDQTYLDGVKASLYQLHFGDYGGLVLRVVSFVLGFISCFVILSGVLIWLTARDRVDVPLSRKRFNERVVWIYLAICLSMFPVTALSFVIAKLMNPVGQTLINSFYLITWLVVSVFLVVKKDNSFTTRFCLLSGGVLGLGIPVVNGFTGNWLWTSIQENHVQLIVVDSLWIVLSAIALLVFLKMRRKGKEVMGYANRLPENSRVRP